jgi:hypothetical protein
MITNAIDAAVPSLFQPRPEAARQRITSTDDPYFPPWEGSLHDDDLVQLLRRAALYATDDELVGLVRTVVRVLETSGRCLVTVPGGTAAMPSSSCSSPLMLIQPGVYTDTLQHQLFVLEALFQQQQEQRRHDEFWQETLSGLLRASAVDASMPWTGSSPTLTNPSPITPLFFDPLSFEQEVEESNSSRSRQGSALIPPSYGIEESTAMMMMGHTINVTPSRSTTTTTTTSTATTTTTLAHHSFDMADGRPGPTSSVCEIKVVSLVATVCETRIIG